MQGRRAHQQQHHRIHFSTELDITSHHFEATALILNQHTTRFSFVIVYLKQQ